MNFVVFKTSRTSVWRIKIYIAFPRSFFEAMGGEEGGDDSEDEEEESEERGRRREP